MRTTYDETAKPWAIPSMATSTEWSRLPRLAAITAIALLAAVLRFANLWSLGYANSYYAAGVEAMLQSWHNFFFVAAEPGGSVSLDKPPVGFWLQAISARFLGVNSLGLLLPQILAGIISVVVVYHLVRRRFGTVAGLLAALVLAITPVVIATDRNNTIDSTLILALLLAAWAFTVATERGSLRHLLLGATLVGIGFNIKMMEAFLPLPAFYALYLFGSPERLWRKLGNLALASALLLVVSLSWATIVDLTPADQRPYVGSSGDNSELNLAIGYNGVERLLGRNGRGGLLNGLLGGSLDDGSRNGRQAGPQGFGPDGRSPQQAADAQSQANPGDGGQFQPRAQGQPVPDGFGGGPGGGGGMFNTGQPGVLRLFTQPLSKEVSWLLPFGLFGAVLLASRTRPRWPIAPKHQALVLWGGWLITGGVFFSVAGFFHQYYLSMLAPPLAALVGIGTMELWDIRKQHRWVASALLPVAAGGTMALQFFNARAFVANVWWLPLAAAALIAGTVLLAVAARREGGRLAIAGVTLVVAAMLVTPAVWSGLTSMDPSTSSNLPAAYGEQGFARGGQMRGPGNDGRGDGNQALLDYLKANTQGTKYLVAVASANQGSSYVLATGRPVLYMGGFSGQDKVVTADDLSRMATDGELKYILSGGGGPGGGQSDVSSWISANCTPVQGLSTQSQNGGFDRPGGMGGTLYQVNATIGSNTKVGG